MTKNVYNNERLHGFLYSLTKYVSEILCNRGFTEVAAWPERIYGPHLVMRLENQLVAIYIEIKTDDAFENKATSEVVESMDMFANITNGVSAIVEASVTLSDDNMHFTINRIDSLMSPKSKAYIDFDKFDYGELIEISEWELLDFATQIAMKCLINIGHVIQFYDTRPECDAPFIVSKFKGETFQCFICASRRGEIVPSLPNDLRMRIAILTKTHNMRVLVAPITISNLDSFGDDKIEWKPLYRGKPTVAREFKFEELTVYKKQFNKNN